MLRCIALIYNQCRQMENLLLQTKLNIPVIRENIVARRRLIKQLNDGLIGKNGFSRRLTLVSAPAGYGKTTAVLQWLTGLELEVLWLSLDEEDNDPVRFMSYLVAVFQQVDSNFGISCLEMLKSPQPPQIEAFTTLLINDLTKIQEPLILALDDYHFIQNPMIHQLVSFLLEHEPAHLHQVILTREDPLLPISRLLSRGQACELRQDDLRFTSDETADFINHTMGLKLSGEEIKILQKRTEGWVAGLQFAALSLQGRVDAHDFIKYFAGSDRYILDYLFEEVFAQQIEGVQDFLMRTSILEQLTADLCDHTVDGGGSRKMLESLERANLFIFPLDPTREWYRYHRLFRDLLRHRLRIRFGEKEAQLHLRASEWYQKHGFQSDAVHHTLAAADWKRASELVLGLSDSMMRRGQIITLLDWYKKFPDSVIRSDPKLCLEYIWPLILTGQNELADTLLRHIEAAPQDDPQFLGSVASARAYLARAEGDIPNTIKYSQRALALVPEGDASLRSILAINLGIAYWHTGQMEDAVQALNEARRTAHESKNYYAQLAALIFYGRVEAVKGNLRQAAELFQQAIQNGKTAPLVALAHFDLGDLYFEWDDLETSQAHVLQGQGINEKSGNIEFRVPGYMLLTRIEGARGNAKGINDALEKIKELEGSTEVHSQNRNRILALRAEFALRQGDLVEAQQLADQMGADVDPHSFFRFLGLIKERLLIAQGRKKEAAQLLHQKARAAESAEWTYGFIAARILQALAAENQEAALQFLTEALERAHEQAFIRIFADSGRDLLPILLEAAQRGVYPKYVGQILTASKEMTLRETPHEAQVERLSERELEVLRLVSAGLSNREIAAKLYLSPGTIKTHVHNICGKLGASNRTQAVVRAKDLNLI